MTACNRCGEEIVHRDGKGRPAAYCSQLCKDARRKDVLKTQRAAASAGRNLRVLSYGGGTQSAALALMSAAGVLPRLDAVIFADTEAEMPETYDYADYVKSRLDAAEIPFIVLSAGSLEAAILSDVPSRSNPTLPVHVLNGDGTRGHVNSWRCSYNFKRRIITQEEKRLCGGPGAWKKSLVEQWLGFSVEEYKRMKQDGECRCGDGLGAHLEGSCTRCECEVFDRWRINTFPLVDLNFKRADTIAWFGANGHPTPPRSACFFCPNSSPERWRLLKRSYPDLWDRACAIDDRIRDGAEFRSAGGSPFSGQMFLHSQRVALRVADVRSRDEVLVDSGVLALFGDEESGLGCDGEVCFT